MGLSLVAAAALGAFTGWILTMFSLAAAAATIAVAPSAAATTAAAATIAAAATTASVATLLLQPDILH